MVIREDDSKMNLFPSNISNFEGNKELKLLLILLAIDPSISGILITGSTGSGKSLVLRFFQQWRIPIKTYSGCSYNCTPTCISLCIGCKEKQEMNQLLKSEEIITPLVKMPVHTQIEALVGSLNLQLHFQPGILGHANNGFLLIDDFHLVPSDIANILMNVWQSKRNIVRRNAVSVDHPSDFCLISTLNPDNFELETSWVDKFAFAYSLHYDNSIETRINIINRNLYPDISQDDIISQITPKSPSEVIKEITRARESLKDVHISHENLSFIAQICTRYQLDGARADISLAKGAKALACLQNRTEVSKNDVLFLVPYVLKHRMSSNDVNDLIQFLETFDSETKDDSPSPDSEKKELSNIPLKQEVKGKAHRIIERVVTVLSIFMITYLFSLIIITTFSVPSIFLAVFGILSVWGIGTFLLYLWVRQRQKLNAEYGYGKKRQNSSPDNSSFSQVKTLRLTSSTKEDERSFKKEVVFDLEEDRSKRGKVLRFIGLRNRRGLITLSERQRYWVLIFGLILIITSIIFYTVLILVLPPEIWIVSLLFILCLFSIGFLVQFTQDQWRIKRAADIGASPSESSKKTKGDGIGSHLTPLGFKNPKEDSNGQYGNNLWQKLADLDLIKNNQEKMEGQKLMVEMTSGSSGKHFHRVLAEKLPRNRLSKEKKFRLQSGKRALSLTSLHSGRVVGDQSFKDYPKNIHVLATIINSLRRNPHIKTDSSSRAIQLRLQDIREKKYCSRVSATIIFVLDLSESIVNVINTVSSSVKWLSRQAYLYRDRVGLVILKGTQGVIIQPPTSNLNLVKRKLKDLRVSGSTPLPAGLQKAIELIKLDRIRSHSETVPMIILITDGATNIPLLKDPLTGISRDTPLKELGIDRAVSMSIRDCLTLTQTIKKEKISLSIFSANIKGNQLFQRIPKSQQQSTIDFLETLISNSNLFKGKQFIQLWSYTLLRSMQEIARGHLFFLSNQKFGENFETLRIARAEILSNIKS